MKITMLDVSRKAGVSKATVSRVLNRKEIVRPDLVKRVYDAIEETGYRPNILAQNLANRKTNFIGFVISNSLFDGPYFSTLMTHAASFCEEVNHQLVMTDGKHSRSAERDAVNLLLDMKCAGIIIYPRYLNEKDLEEIIRGNETPVIVLNRDLPNYPQNRVITDHYKSALLMTDYLAEQGHSRIAIIRGAQHSSTEALRYRAYRDSLESHGFPHIPELEELGDWTPESGYSAAENLLQLRVMPTAVLACNDDMAIGAIKALLKSGVKVPEEVSVAGFDNSRMGKYSVPGLTSVSVPLENMVKKAILRIMGEHRKAESVSVSGSLVIRESVASK